MDIEEIRKKMVLIRQRFDVKILNNEGRWGEKKSGFSIRQPVIGFVKKELWKNIDIFQNLNIDIKSELVSKVVLAKGKELTYYDYEGCPDLHKWLDLIKRTGRFTNTVFEFNLITGTGDKEHYVRSFSLLGINEWELVDF